MAGCSARRIASVVIRWTLTGHPAGASVAIRWRPRRGMRYPWTVGSFQRVNRANSPSASNTVSWTPTVVDVRTLSRIHRSVGITGAWAYSPGHRVLLLLCNPVSLMFHRSVTFKAYSLSTAFLIVVIYHSRTWYTLQTHFHTTQPPKGCSWNKSWDPWDSTSARNCSYRLTAVLPVARAVIYRIGLPGRITTRGLSLCRVFPPRFDVTRAGCFWSFRRLEPPESVIYTGISLFILGLFQQGY